MPKPDEYLVQNAADPEQVKHGQSVQKRRLERARKDRQAIMASREGRRYLWRLINVCGVFDCAYEDPHAAAYTNGRRSVGATIMREIMEIDPGIYGLMLKESFEDE